MGNLVNWEETNWFLNSSKGTAREDYSNFGGDDDDGQGQVYMVTEDMSTCHIPTILTYGIARITYTPLIGAMPKRNYSFLQDKVPKGCDYHVIHLV